MKNKIFTIFLEGFKRGQFLRLKEHDVLHLYLGKDENGRYALEYQGHYTPAKLLGSEVISVTQTKNNCLYSLCFSLENADLLEYFCTFCEDLINSTFEIADEDVGYKTLSQRYLSWKKLFRPNQARLNENEIMGLIGELLYLKDQLFLKHGVDKSLESWTGPEYTHKDFSIDDEWHEIKTVSVGKGSIRISSIEQLDSDIPGTLAVYELEKMSSTYNGLKINTIVSDIIGNLSTVQREVFMGKLSQYGYDFSPEYNNYVYTVANFSRFVVDWDFPRLKRELMPMPIARVQYDILLAEISSFRLP